MNLTLMMLIAVSFLVTAMCWYFVRDDRFGNGPIITGTVGIVSVVVAIFGFYQGKAGMSLDYEFLNGEIIQKRVDKVSCEHSYSCNCTTSTSCSGSGASRSCSTSTHCQTCYEHSHDFDWMIISNVGDLKVKRIDPQGVKTPPRWQSAVLHEPFAARHEFTNYIKGAGNNILTVKSEMLETKFKGLIPEYPISIYDLYRAQRAVAVGVKVPDLNLWNDDISNALRTLGPNRQANLIILFVNTADPGYEQALDSAWLGGKKNDIIVIVGTSEYPKINFVRVMSWTDKEIFKIKLRDSLESNGEIDREFFMKEIMRITMQDFKRKSMKDFAYLEHEIEPPTWMIVSTIFAILLVGGIGIGYYTLNNRGNKRRSYRWR